MALSGSNTVNIGNQFVRLRITWEAVQNIENNTSTITARLFVDLTTASLNVGSRSDATITIDGITTTFTANAVNRTNFTGETFLGTVTRTVNHNADGTKALTVTGVWPARATISGTYYATVTVSHTDNLDTIPRASQPTLNVSSQSLGSAITISTNRASTAFTHTLKYTFGNQSGTIATGVGASQSWTLPNTLANAIPNAQSGSGTITCETYNGSTLIGTRTVAFTATVPNNATFQPNASISSITEGQTGLTAFSVFIQNISRLRVQSTGSGNFSATISQYRVTIDGGHLFGADVTFNPINKNGTLTVTLLVTDSRGYSRTVTQNVTLVAYFTPRINSFSASRSPNDQGTDLSAPINFEIAPVSNQNTKYYRVRYRVVGGSWVLLFESTAYYTRSTTHSASGVLNANNSYDVELFVQDSFTSATQTVIVTTAFDLLNFNNSGKGLAIGKVSEGDLFEVALLFKALEVITAEKGVSFIDTRSINDAPSEKPPKAISFDFKLRTSVGNPPLEASASSTNAHIITVAGWSTGEGSGGWPMQLSIGNTAIAIRQATSATTWGPWTLVGGVDLSGYTPTSRTLTAGNGLTGGGTLESNRTFTLGTPGTITPTSSNGVTSTSHTHAINFDVVHSHGSNSNGSWIRFTNGIQICWFNDTGSINASTTTGTQTRWNSKAFTFPAAFNAVPMIASDAFRNGGNLGWTAIQERSATGCSIYILSDFTTQSLLSYMAIGTWS